MTRTNLALLAVLIASSLYLVNVSYESRQLFTALHRAQAQARTLRIEHERLQIEHRAQSTPLRVEKLAREKLHMRSATPAVTEYVTLPPGSALQAARAAATQPPPAAAKEPPR